METKDRKKIDTMPGRKFGWLEVLERKGKTPCGAFKYLCKCICGELVEKCGSDMRKGRVTKCQRHCGGQRYCDGSNTRD